jgi:fibronectin type 3 domain-containing protein
MINSSLVASESYADTTVSAGQSYYYVVTSVSNGVESAYSPQVTAVVPAS